MATTGATPTPGMETRIALVEKEIQTVFGLFSRFEIALEKMSDVSGQLKEMIAVHENRLQVQERTDTAIFDQIERRKEEYVTLFEKINTKISENSNEIKNSLNIEMKEHYMEVRDAINDSRESQKELIRLLNVRIDQQVQNRDDQMKNLAAEHDKLVERVAHLEKWRWMIIGGGMLFGGLVGSFPIWSKFFAG
jgi:hypothetical protein